MSDSLDPDQARRFVLKTGGTLVHVKSIAECSTGGFCNIFRPALSGAFCNTFDLH